MKNTLIIIIALLVGTPIIAEDQLKVWVHAGIDQDEWEDWTQQDLNDSARDLRGYVKGKFWQNTLVAEDADVALMVIARYNTNNGQITTRYNTITGWETREGNMLIVEVLMTLRNGKQRIFQSTHPGNYGWKASAKSVKISIERWLKKNHSRIIVLREAI